MTFPRYRLGVWLAGASGNIACTTVLGHAAIRRGLAEPIGLATQEPPLSKLPLAPLASLHFGGHEIHRSTPADTLRQLARRSGLFSDALMSRCAGDIRRYTHEIWTGAAVNAGPAIRRLADRPGADARRTGRQIIDRLRRDLDAFRARHRLDGLVVINLASTEPNHAAASTGDWRKLSRRLSGLSHGLPPSSLYAIAAIEADAPYVNFTPSRGADLPAIRELAAIRRVPIMGSDGKTGETLLRSTLAPMFADRCLRVLSWTGFNILGNRDGRILSSPSNKASKLRMKDQLLRALLPSRPDAHTAIEFVESLDDWKTAWDHVHFAGFLGTKMSLQFIWQGCDSILAAPLVLDLARLADFHARRGEGDVVMRHLASYFKTPMDVKEQRFAHQVRMLHDYAARALAAGRKR